MAELEKLTETEISPEREFSDGDEMGG